MNLSNLFYVAGSTFGGFRIVKANLDGTSQTDLITGLGGPQYLALDSAHIYWVDTTGPFQTVQGTIHAANLDGSGAGSACPTTTGTPTGQTASPIPSCIVLGAGNPSTWVAVGP